MSCKLIPRSGAGLLILGLAGVLALSGTASAQAFKVGIVKLDEVLDSWESVKAFEAEINAEIEATQKKIDTLKAEIEQLEKDITEALEVMDPTSEDLQNLQAQRRKKLAELKATNDFNLVALQRRVREKTVEFYEQVVERIRAYGAKNGYHLILKAEDAIDVADDQTSLRLKIAMRTVLYFDVKLLDITKALIAELNAQ